MGVWRSCPLRDILSIGARLRVGRSRREIQEGQAAGEQQGCRDSGGTSRTAASVSAAAHRWGDVAGSGGDAGGSAEGGWLASTHQGVPAAAAHEGHKPGLFVCSGEPDNTIPQREQAGEADMREILCGAISPKDTALGPSQLIALSFASVGRRTQREEKFSL